jgi:ribonuclease HI
VKTKTLKTTTRALPLLAVLMAGTVVWAASPERYLHVRVSNPGSHELVRVNVPLSLASKVIPAINHGQLRDGKVQIGDFHADEVNVRAIIDALKTAPEGEFVTVQNNDNDVRVAKEHGQLVVHVLDKGHGGDSKQNVDVTIPWEVAQALISNTTEHQLNIEAAIHALESAGDITLVRVTGQDENVRVWIDSNSSDK